MIADEASVNARDPRAGDPWLGFPVTPYVVARALRDGDVLEGLEVIHTPGQTPGHVAYSVTDVAPRSRPTSSATSASAPIPPAPSGTRSGARSSRI